MQLISAVLTLLGDIRGRKMYVQICHTPFFLIHPQIFGRRQEIILEQLNVGRDQDWKRVQNIFKLFDPGDMSSDETETEEGFGTAKVVRRVRKWWIDDSVSQLWRVVDSQYNPHKPSGLLKRGTKPMLRIWQSSQCNTRAEPKPGLPRNFYDHHVVNGSRLESLQPAEEMSLTFVSAFATVALLIISNSSKGERSDL
jgi:hypothetical protein